MKRVTNRRGLRSMLRNKWKALPLILLLGLFNGLFAQSNTNVKGVVSDATSPLPGVTVIVKGVRGSGAVTDAKGQYLLRSLPSDAVLQFSMIGYETQEIAWSGRSQIDVLMRSSTKELDEVVVIGYGSVRKKDLTGAVASLGGEKIAARQTTQIATALQGAIAGLTVTRSSSAPGTGATLRIRGITSIQESDPLVIVDGVPVGSINDVNPADIEDISVLKDAASASIYGSRAAAGVVLITTKRGSRSGSSIEYTSSYSIDKPTKMPEYADAVRYMQAQNELAWNDNPSGGEYAAHPADLIDNYYTLNAENPDKYPNTNWLDYILKESALRQSHNLSFADGDKKRRTKVGIGYEDAGGLFRYNLGYERVTARVNNDINFNKFISASVDMFGRRVSKINPVYSPSSNMRYLAPIYAAEWSDGRIAEGKTRTNPYGLLKEGGNTKGSDAQIGGRISLDVTPFDGLKVSGVFSPTFNYVKNKVFAIAVPFTSWDKPDTPAGFLEGAENTKLTEGRDDSYKLTSQFLISYDKKISGHSLNAMAGYENYYSFYESLATARDKYDLKYYPYLDAGPMTELSNSGNAYEYAYRSYFGRLMYNYNQKYYLQANIRYDGSSRFHKDYRWGAFPSFSAGWVLSEEKFLKDLPILSFLKLRGSWGQLGNERIGNYPYQATLSFNYPVLYQEGEVQSAQGASAYQYVIPDISWETTESYNIGLDAQFFKNRLRFTGDLYKKVTKDMLLTLQIPLYLGYSNPQQNAGKMHTKGWEIELGYNDKINDFNYSISANLSDFKSVMGNLKGTQFLGAQVKFEGSEFNEWYGYKSMGIYQKPEDALNSPRTATTVTAGDIQYMDISGPEGVPDGQISPDYDKVLLGGSLPRYVFGGNINASYKGIDFSLVFQGVGKQKALLSDEMARPLRAQWYNVPEIVEGNYWSQYNTEEQNLRARYPRLSDVSGTNNYATSDFWLFDGSYFRLKNITLGYTLPKVKTQRLMIQNMRIFANLTDFFTSSHYPTGWDPETSDTGYPITKSVVLGLSVKF
ncbi:SusC/RagA family TonB-linked outer membrane protein [Arcticibacter tournemirensis]